VLCKTANIIFVFPFAPIANSVMAFPPLFKRGKKERLITAIRREMKFAGTPLPVLEILTQHSSYNAAKVIASVILHI